MIDHKVHFGRLAFALFLISIAAGAFWKYGLRGPIRLSALQVLQARSATPSGVPFRDGFIVQVFGLL